MAGALSGLRVVVPVTRDRRALADLLETLGAQVTAVEFLAIAPPHDVQAVRTAVREWTQGRYDWLAVTSRNAVESLVDCAGQESVSLAGGHGQVAAVGAATRRACEDAGLPVALVPTERADAAGLVHVFPHGPGRVLAPLGNRASTVLERGLRAKGWDVVCVEAYRTERGAGMDATTTSGLVAGAFDAVVLTSGSVADAVADQCGAPPAARVVAMGGTTAAAWRRRGYAVDAIAATPTYDALVECLMDATAEGGPP